MFEDQLFLLAAIFSANADSTNCETLWAFFNGSDELFDIICSLWPELDDPTKLKFLFDSSGSLNSKYNSNPRELLIELLETNEQLISMVEMDPDTIAQRRQAITRYAKEFMKQVPPYDRTKFSTANGERLRKRLIICNELSDQLPMQYHSVSRIACMKDEKLSQWIKGIVEPLEYLNKRLNTSIKIKEFENMDPINVFEIILNAPDENPDAVVQRELMPYMTNSRHCELFLNSILTPKYFPLSSNYNFEIFYQLIPSFSLPGQEANRYLERVQRQCAFVVFKGGPNYLKIGPKSRLDQLLLDIGDETPVEPLGITVATLRNYSSLTEKSFRGYHMQDLYSISKNEELVQESHFASITRKCLETVVSEEATMKQLRELFNHDKSSQNIVFSQLSERKQLSIVIEILLELGNFSFLHKLIATYQYKVSEEVLEKYFWHFFNMAASGQRHGKDLVNAEKIVNLLLVENEAKYTCLKVLLDVTMDVSDYSINWGRSLTFRPSHILQFKEDQFGLISLLLESNRRLYKDIPVTYSILQKLLVAFGIENHRTTDTEENLIKILVLHIDHALVNMDFQFAYENTRELLKKRDIIDCWPTILQVGKFVDPSWRDGETPTEIIFLQLEVLGELLQICPVNEVEVVASQWSALELELLTRDLVEDPYSLEKSSSFNSLIQNGVSLNGVSNTIANFLSRS